MLTLFGSSSILFFFFGLLSTGKECLVWACEESELLNELFSLGLGY
jgi:hypothetical protein